MGRVQKSLFPHLDEYLDNPFTEQEKRLVAILEIVQVEKYISSPAVYQWRGRKPFDRQSLARAFVTKTLYRIPTTSDLIRALQATKNLRRICGFSATGNVPSESTFSRAFAEFAASELGKEAHNALVQEYLADELIGHISRDSTAIVGREKPAKKVKMPQKPRKRGRPAKSEKREPAPLKRLDRQVSLSAEKAILELPTLCDRGTKKNAKGYKTSWNGYKLHLDINDMGLPVSALVTSASLHDSQVAIPLIKQTSSKVTYLYDLMDAAYDAKRINETSRKFGHVPIIDKNARGKEVIPMAPHEAERYKIRSSAEWANGRLKEDFGANNVMVKGYCKVTQHLMFGVIVLFADQLIRQL
ncbi:transposase [Desulfogranum marinum]|uniref:transposase n=1 Tax=Desulfogranum marinum TaxID=453220 RepID=UPI00374DCE15